MTEFFRFVLETPANFFGSVFLMTYFYVLFGSAGLNVVRDIIAFRRYAADKRVEEKRVENDRYHRRPTTK